MSKSRTLLPAGMGAPLIADGAGLTVTVTGRPAAAGARLRRTPAITAAAPAETMSTAARAVAAIARGHAG